MGPHALTNVRLAPGVGNEGACDPSSKNCGVSATTSPAGMDLMAGGQSAATLIKLMTSLTRAVGGRSIWGFRQEAMC